MNNRSIFDCTSTLALLASIFVVSLFSIVGCRQPPTEKPGKSNSVSKTKDKQQPAEDQNKDDHSSSPKKDFLAFTDETREIVLDKRVNEDQLKQICSLASLETLCLDGGGVSIDQIDLILKLKKLEHLRIRNFPATDREIGRLSELVSLRILNLPQAKFSNKALKKLAFLKHLQLLRFSSPHVSDEGIKELKNYPSLRALHLIRVPITNKSVESLCAIKTLESLYLDGSKIDDPGFSRILKLRPDVHLHVDQVHLDYDPNKHEHRP